ncbi:MAG: hypothetical protein KatS3mg042_0105 [Rhodothermaceae bacterium]|nr:MAG: hypothetical protein KatS3mg042_0105 [Rhodothermaceae bacterium]
MRKVCAILWMAAWGVWCAAAQPAAPPFAWEGATVYYVVTDRFANGDPANDHAYGRGFDAAGQPYALDPVGHFHGGDLAGLTQKIEEGYFEALGVDALAITSPFEQVHGWMGGGPEGDIQQYAYHGAWTLDYTALDAALGTDAAFRRFVRTAHAHGLRVLIDVVLDHPGPATPADMDAFGFGALRDEGWRTWRPGPGESWHTYHARFVDAAGTDSAWARWWGPGWVRADLPGHDPCGDDALTACAGGLPDFKTESSEPVALPIFLRAKWGPEKTAREEAALEAFFARTGYPRTPRYYLIKWVTDWVERHGIDGFRITGAGQVEAATWQALKQEATRALRAWKAAHPDEALDEADFWMVAGDDAAPPSADKGFDAVCEDTFRGLARAPEDRLDSLYAAHAQRRDTAPVGVLAYLSSPGAGLFDRGRLVEGGTRLLLMPGAVQLFYGDETARPPGPSVSDPVQPALSPMNWSAVEEGVRAHWQAVGAFRKRHPSVARGTHAKLSDAPYAFMRTFRYGAYEDRVVVALGAAGATRLNVSHAFPDDTVLRDALTGRIGIVSYGMISVAPHASGVILLEEVK